GQARRGAPYEEESDQPAEFGQVQRRGRIGRSHCADSPRVSEHGRCDTKTHHIGERIKLLAEFAVRAHRPRHTAIKRIEQNRKTDGASGVIKIGYFAIERRKDGEVTTANIRNVEKPRK